MAGESFNFHGEPGAQRGPGDGPNEEGFDGPRTPAAEPDGPQVQEPLPDSPEAYRRRVEQGETERAKAMDHDEAAQPRADMGEEFRAAQAAIAAFLQRATTPEEAEALINGLASDVQERAREWLLHSRAADFAAFAAMPVEAVETRAGELSSQAAAGLYAISTGEPDPGSAEAGLIDLPVAVEEIGSEPAAQAGAEASREGVEKRAVTAGEDEGREVSPGGPLPEDADEVPPAPAGELLAGADGEPPRENGPPAPPGPPEEDADDNSSDGEGGEADRTEDVVDREPEALLTPEEEDDAIVLMLGAIYHRRDRLAAMSDLILNHPEPSAGILLLMERKLEVLSDLEAEAARTIERAGARRELADAEKELLGDVEAEPEAEFLTPRNGLPEWIRKAWPDLWTTEVEEVPSRYPETFATIGQLLSTLPQLETVQDVAQERLIDLAQLERAYQRSFGSFRSDLQFLRDELGEEFYLNELQLESRFVFNDMVRLARKAERERRQLQGWLDSTQNPDQRLAIRLGDYLREDRWRNVDLTGE